MRKILLFVNPNARSGRDWCTKAREWAKKQGLLVLNDEDSPDFGETIFKFQDQAEVVVVGGGDGSLNAALPALMKTKLPLAVLPLGTANNLARTLGIPTDPEKAFSLLQTGKITEIDVGVANGIPFLNVIGLGLSTQVNRMSRSEMKRWLGVFAFIWTALKVGYRMTPFRIFVEFDGKKHSGKTWQISICNGRNYGSGLTIHQDATLQDQLLHGLSTELEKWWHIFTLIPALISGRFRPDHDVSLFQGKLIKISTRNPMRVDVDGDIKTQTPLEISVAPKALKLAPKNVLESA